MLEKLYVYSSAATRLRSSPLGARLDSFVGRLFDLGYARGSCRSYVVLAADLGRWMAQRSLSIGSLDEAAIEMYLHSRVTQRERRRAASALMLAHLRAEGVTPPPSTSPDNSPVAIQVRHYAAYMRKERGAAEGTIEGYVHVVRSFLVERFGSGEMDLGLLKASDVGKYLTDRGRELSPKRVAYLASALGSFLRFIFIRGLTVTDLSAASLTSQTIHRRAVDRYLSPEQVGQLLDTCDPSTRTGRRNRAILLLLARLGLRAAEVAALDLDDIRWRSGEIVIRGKGDSVDRLPLPTDVGEALRECHETTDSSMDLTFLDGSYSSNLRGTDGASC